MKFRTLTQILAAAACLALTAACSGTATRESTGEYVDSSIISNKVRAAILAEKGISIVDIDVTTFRGVVQLSGFVDNAQQKHQAEVVARTVAGVRDVKNNIQIKPR